MMASTGIATFHQVTRLLTLVNTRIARKLTAVKSAISTMVTTNPVAVVTFLVGSYRLGQ